MSRKMHVPNDRTVIFYDPRIETPGGDPLPRSTGNWARPR